MYSKKNTSKNILQVNTKLKKKTNIKNIKNKSNIKNIKNKSNIKNLTNRQKKQYYNKLRHMIHSKHKEINLFLDLSNFLKYLKFKKKIINNIYK